MPEKRDQHATSTLTVKHLLTMQSPYNPRKISDHEMGSLRRSLSEFGAVEPVVVNKRTKRIVGGHQRLKAAKAEGIERFPVVYVNLDETGERQLNLALNRIAGSWDDEMLVAVLKEIQDADGDLALTGFEDAELKRLLQTIEGGETSPDALPSDVEKRCNSGDLWILGEHRLMCGDCRNTDDMSRLMDGRTIDLAFTSPPYASQRKYDEESGFRPIHPDAYIDWFEPVQENIQKRLASHGSWFVNITEASDSGLKLDYVKRLCLKHVDDWSWMWVEEYCWLRPALPLDPNRSRRFKNGWESVYHFSTTRDYKFNPDEVRHESDGVFKYSDQKAAGKMIGGDSQGKGGGLMSPVYSGHGLAYPSNVIDAKSGAKIVGHSAAFPAELPEFFIRAFTDESDSVLDPFMGSGTTIIAAEKTGRCGYGVEISAGYCDLILARWESFTGREAQLDG